MGAIMMDVGMQVAAKAATVELVAVAHRSAVVGRHIVTDQFISADVDVVITTGQSHPRLTPNAIAVKE